MNSIFILKKDMVLSLNQFKTNLDPQLKEYVDSKTEELLKNTNDKFIKDILIYSKNLITGGGKRIRPYMAYLAYVSFGGASEKEIIKILLALELFHNYALIHDDIIDKGRTRHGQKTIHLYTYEKLFLDKRFGDLEHVAKSYAIIVGDILFGWISQLFFQSHIENKELAEQYFNKMADEVLMGQIIDADLASRQNPSLELIEEKTRLKTSRYTFVRPMQIGAVLANKNYGKEDFLDKLGTKLGVAFQMKDDLLDIVGNQKNIQKTPLLDISQHQHTFFTDYVFQYGTPEQKNFLKQCFGKNVTGNEEKIRKMFEISGAIDKGVEVIKKNLSQAKSMIEQSTLGEDYKQNFLEIIRLIEERNN